MRAEAAKREPGLFDLDLDLHLDQEGRGGLLPAPKPPRRIVVPSADQTFSSFHHGTADEPPIIGTRSLTIAIPPEDLHARYRPENGEASGYQERQGA